MGFTGLCPSNMETNAGSGEEALRKNCSIAVGYDEFYRQDMFAGGPFLLGSSVRSINKLAYAGLWEPKASPPWEDDPMLDRTNALYQAARKLIRLRSRCPVLNEGRTVWHDSEWRPSGVMSFSRITYSPMAAEALVVLNP